MKPFYIRRGILNTVQLFDIFWVMFIQFQQLLEGDEEMFTRQLHSVNDALIEMYTITKFSAWSLFKFQLYLCWFMVLNSHSNSDFLSFLEYAQSKSLWMTWFNTVDAYSYIQIYYISIFTPGALLAVHCQTYNSKFIWNLL